MRRFALLAIALAWAVPAWAYDSTPGGSPIVFMSNRSDVTQTNGAVCDGTTDDTTALNAAAATSPVLLPRTTCFTNGSAGSLSTGTFYSPDRGYITSVESSVNEKQSSNLSIIKATPTRASLDTFIFSAFDGDTSHIAYPCQTRITGATTLGQPATGYQDNPYVSCAYLVLNIGSTTGWNQFTDHSDGRTNASAIMGRVIHQGMGDGGLLYAKITVSGAKPSATTWLANPAGFIVGGQVAAGADGVYLEPIGDIDCKDLGFDVSCMSMVLNSSRTNATAALNQAWSAIRLQDGNGATKAIDSKISLQGLTRIGIDLASLNLTDLSGSTVKSAIVLGDSQGIYFNGSKTNGALPWFSNNTTVGTSYFDFESALGFNLVQAGTALMKTTTAGIELLGTAPKAVTQAVNTNDTTIATSAALVAQSKAKATSFTASGTFTKSTTPAPVLIDMYMFSQGGCGGGGAREPFGTVASGGGGGGGGMRMVRSFLTADFPSSVTLTFATPCTGGAGAASAGAGTSPVVGADVTVNTTPAYTAFGGGSGQGGANNAATGGGGGAGPGSAGANGAAATGGNGGNGSGLGGSGGNGGSGAAGSNPTATNALYGGSAGGGGASVTAGNDGAIAIWCPGGGSGGTLLAASGSAGGRGGSNGFGVTQPAAGTTGATGGNGGVSKGVGADSLMGGTGSSGGGAGTTNGGGNGGSTSSIPCVGGGGGGGGVTGGGNGAVGGPALVVFIEHF